MSAGTTQEPSPGTGNGTAATTTTVPAPKRRIANSTIDGSIVTVSFTSGEKLTLDAAKIPSSITPAVTAYGAANIVQTAYNASKEPVKAAQGMIARLLAGDWQPGRPKSEIEPDPLVVALAEHLKKDHGFVEDTYLPAYASKHGLGSVGAARRKLRTHPDVAPRIAEITAERAKAAMTAAKKTPHTSLDL
jgi:hypothetical protein